MADSAVPAGFSNIVPYLHIRNAAKAIGFYQNVFAAQEVMRLTMPDGSIGHAEIKIGNAHIMLSEENPNWGNKGSETLQGTTCSITFYTPDCDAIFEKAIAAGATQIMPMADQFYGHRSGSILDPFGHKWTIGRQIKEMTAVEMQTAMDAMLKG